MKPTANRLVLIIGAFILALMAVDGLVQLNRAAMSEFGLGTSHWVNADSAAALFLIGLVAGVVLGIAVVFGYLMWREKKYAEEPDSLDTLLDELAEEEEDENPLFVEENSFEEKAENLDPWEKPADWWKSTEED
ncbi:MAG: hypothetical protein AAGC68_10370 [Verrucomicrobiota bacterium]